MLSFYIIFGDRNPPYPALGSNIPSVRRPGQRFHFLLCRGSSPSPSFLKQAWRNPKEGRVGYLHQNIFTRKVTDIAFTSDFCDNHSHPASPASLLFILPNESNKPFETNAWGGVTADNFPVVLIFQKKTYKEQLLCYHLLPILKPCYNLSLHWCQFTCTLWNFGKK